VQVVDHMERHGTAFVRGAVPTRVYRSDGSSRITVMPRRARCRARVHYVM
jgi:hypothetical protein